MPESSVPLLPSSLPSRLVQRPLLFFFPLIAVECEGGGKVPAKTIDAARPFWKPKTPNFEGKLLCVCPIISGCFFLGGRRPVLRYEAISHFYCPPLHASLRKNLFHRRLSAAAQACIGEEEEEEVRFYCCLLSPSLPPPQVEKAGEEEEEENARRQQEGRREEEEECNGTTCETLCLPSAMLRLHQPKGGGGRRHVSLACVWRRRRRIQEDLSSLPASPQSNGGGPLLLLPPSSPFCVPSGKNLAPANLESGEGESRTRKGKKGGRKGKLPPSTHTQEGGDERNESKGATSSLPFCKQGGLPPLHDNTFSLGARRLIHLPSPPHATYTVCSTFIQAVLLHPPPP